MAFKGGNVNKKDLNVLHKAAYKRNEDNNFVFSNRALNIVKLSRKKKPDKFNIYKNMRKSLRKTKNVKKNRKSKSKTFKKSRKSTNSN
tara:strand:+ start:111 stop:374 length:264 start_codon:yes stop_codon:yes gene_type:complete